MGPTPILGTLEIFNFEELPQVYLQSTAQQLLDLDSNEPETSSHCEWTNYFLNNLPQYSRLEAPTSEIVEATLHFDTNWSGLFDGPNYGCQDAKRHVDGYWNSGLFDSECIGNIISLAFWKRVGINASDEPDYTSVIANHSTRLVAFIFGFYTLSE